MDTVCLIGGVRGRGGRVLSMTKKWVEPALDVLLFGPETFPLPLSGFLLLLSPHMVGWFGALLWFGGDLSGGLERVGC